MVYNKKYLTVFFGIIKILNSTYCPSCAEEAFGFSSDDVGGSVEDILAHGLEQVVAFVAFLAAETVQHYVHTVWGDLANLADVI